MDAKSGVEERLRKTTQPVDGIFGAMFYGANRTQYSWLMGLTYAVIVIVILMTSRNRYLITGNHNERPQAETLTEVRTSTGFVSSPVTKPDEGKSTNIRQILRRLRASVG